jgi:pyruvate ferredoxin oxidoreductase gamma subunit
MLGALIKATGLLEEDALEGPLKRRFGKIAEKNILAYKAAYEKTDILD